MNKILKSHIRASVCIFACISIAFAIGFGSNYRFIYVDGESMSGTISNGEWIIIQKRRNLGQHWIPSVYDVVIARDPEHKGDLLVKRVIALPKDEIEIKDGYIYINDKKLDDMYGHGRLLYYLVDENGEQLHFWDKPSQPAVEYETHGKVVVRDDYVWVIGDNRKDSYYGFVPVKNIIGKVIW